MQERILDQEWIEEHVWEAKRLKDTAATWRVGASLGWESWSVLGVNELGWAGTEQSPNPWISREVG